jgi:hypothetical protein
MPIGKLDHDSIRTLGIEVSLNFPAAEAQPAA